MELNENTQVIIWLWEILNEFCEEDKVKFIKFCWAQERLPSTNEDYERLQIKFGIKPNIDKSKKNQFPKADTCFFTVELSDYTTKDIMKEKILIAINFDNGLNADRAINDDGRGDRGGRGGYRGGRGRDDDFGNFGR